MLQLEIIICCLLAPLLVNHGADAARVMVLESSGCCHCDGVSGVCSNCSESESRAPVAAWVDEFRGIIHLSGAPEHGKVNDTMFVCTVSFFPNSTTIQQGSCHKVVAPRKCIPQDWSPYNISVLKAPSGSMSGLNKGDDGNKLQYPVIFKWNNSSSTSHHPPPPPSYNRSGEVVYTKKPKKTRSFKVYIIGGAAVAGVLTLVSCLFLLRNRKLLSSSKLSSSDRAQILVGFTGSGVPTVFTFKELKSATKSFAENKLLGGGGFSTVYRGKLPDGRIVAVKRMNQGNKQGIQQFQNEVIILSKVRHANLVQLLGYCLEGRDLLLVYEFVSNGTLADHLHGDRGNGLPMELRLSVALDTAHALAYLHFEVNPPIYHRDVKSSNILLDKDFRAKVADFGLSRLTHLDGTHISTAPQGTPGYLDPDYHESYQLTDKSDVYSFGVVLLELVSRKKAVDMSREKKEINLASMALARIHSGQLQELFDPDLSVKHWKLLTRLVEVAFRCLAAEKDDRPSMVEVVAELEQLSSVGVMSFSSRRKIKVDSSGEFKKFRSGSNNSTHSIQSNQSNRLEEESPTSVQMKWPSTHTSPSNSRSEV